MSKIRFIRQQKVCPATGETFTPDRDNQVYINRAVQVKYNNDRGKLKRSELKIFNDILNTNEKILATLLNRMKKYNWKYIPVEYIDFDELNFEVYTSTSKNAETKNIVYWCLNYGFEPVDEKMKLYFIHKK